VLVPLERGGKAGLFHVDNKTQLYVKSRAMRSYLVYEPDPDADYARKIVYDVTGQSFGVIRAKQVGPIDKATLDTYVAQILG